MCSVLCTYHNGEAALPVTVESAMDLLVILAIQLPASGPAYMARVTGVSLGACPGVNIAAVSAPSTYAESMTYTFCRSPGIDFQQEEHLSHAWP